MLLSVFCTDCLHQCRGSLASILQREVKGQKQICWVVFDWGDGRLSRPREESWRLGIEEEEVFFEEVGSSIPIAERPAGP